MGNETWTSERIALLALGVSVIVAVTQVLTWVLHYRIRAKVLIYTDWWSFKDETVVTIEVQNYSHDWTLTVEGAWVSYGYRKTFDVRDELPAGRHRIEPHDASFILVPLSKCPFDLSTRIAGIAKIKTKKFRTRSRWIRRRLRQPPAQDHSPPLP